MKSILSLKPLSIYIGNQFSLPKGEKPGFGNCIFLLSPSLESCISKINHGILNYNMYRNYMIDFIYREKIGFTKIHENLTGEIKKIYGEKASDTGQHIELINNGNRASVLNQRKNLIVDLGKWMEFYFENQIRNSTEEICFNFFQFLRKRIESSIFSNKENARIGNYECQIFIDMKDWINEGRKLGLSKAQLNNPISILLLSLYKYPGVFSNLAQINFIIANSSSNKIMKLTPDTLILKNFHKIKMKVLSMVDETYVDNENINEEYAIDNKAIIKKPIEKMTSEEVLIDRKCKEDQRKNEIREKVIGLLTKNLLGDTDDLTDPDDDGDIESDDLELNEIKNLGYKIMDERPEILDSENPEVAANVLKKEVKKQYYVKKFAPKYTDKQLKQIQELQDQQSTTIGNIDEEIKDMKSKIIDISDFSNVIESTNPSVMESKMTNFSRSYNEKKLQSDIDNAIGALSNGSTKVFVVGKEEEDTSDTLNLKKTVTYHLKDEKGKRMTIKLDIPIIIDDHFMLLGGNKKIIQNMLVLKPLVKTGKAEVQIATNYQKMFIMRKGSMDLKTNALLRFLLNKNNKKEFNVVTGNGAVTNKKYRSTLEYNAIANKIISFEISGNQFIFDMTAIDDLISKKKLDVSKIDFDNQILIGIDEKNKPITMSTTESFVDKIFSFLPEDYVGIIKKQGRKYNGGRLLMYSETKPLQQRAPLVLILMYWEGFKAVMEKAKIKYRLITKEEFENEDIDLFDWGTTDLSNGYIVWERYPTENSLLMNGLNILPMDQYSIEDLESKDTFTYLLTNIYDYAAQSFNLDQYYDFMIDPITKEILYDMHLPMDLVELCLLANKMLRTNEATPESDLRNMRVRNNEIIPYHTYKAITAGYNQYRKTQHRRNPVPITVKQDAVIRSMMKQKASIMNDASSLNPVLEISKLRAITYKGENGTNEEHAFKLNIRAYNETMLGVLGITTSPDSGVGINRQLTLEPNITSTRGYLDIAGKENVEDLNASQLLAPSELLTPLGAQHDDPTRTSMAYKQSMYMVLVEDSDPVLIGNGVEKILPYHLSSDFVINAEDSGRVVEKTDEYLVVQYNNGRYRTIDLTIQFKKNSAAGFYIQSNLVTSLKEGDTFKQNEILAWDDKAFRKKEGEAHASMRLGPLLKIAIIPEWDIYEDSAPATRKASERLATRMVMPIKVALNKNAYVSKILKVGDHVNAGENVIVFDNYHEDPMVMNLIQSLREEERETVIEQNSNKKTSHYTGDIIDIDILTTVPVEELSETLQEIVNENWKKIKRRDKILDKYKNPDDLNFYKSGNVITTSTQPVTPDYKGKVKGEQVDEGVLITFYVGFKDILSRGDKISSEFALKSINSHIIEDGLEPWSEFRPDESIDLITAPLSISARKTPSIFIAMFANKILIEAKRHVKEYWENN